MNFFSRFLNAPRPVCLQKGTLFLLSLLLAFPLCSRAQLWDKTHLQTFTINPNDHHYHAAYCWDSTRGGLIGYVTDSGWALKRTTYICLNKQGDTLWTKKNIFKTSGEEDVTSISHLPNGDFIITAACDTLYPGVLSPYTFILKRIDSNGNDVLTRVFARGVPNGYTDFRAAPAPGGGYYVASSWSKQITYYGPSYNIDSLKGTTRFELYNAANIRIAADSINSGAALRVSGSGAPCPSSVYWNSNRKQFLSAILLMDAKAAADGGLFCAMDRDTARILSLTSCAFVTRPGAVPGGLITKYNSSLTRQWTTALTTALLLRADSMFNPVKLIPTSDSGVIVIGFVADTTTPPTMYPPPSSAIVKLNKAGSVIHVLRTPPGTTFINATEISLGRYLFESSTILNNPSVAAPGLVQCDKALNFLNYVPLPLGAVAPGIARNYSHLEGLTANQYGGAFAPFFRDTSEFGAGEFGLASSLNFDSSLNIYPASVSGKIVLDGNHDCSQNAGDRAMAHRTVLVSEHGGLSKFYAYTDSGGRWTRRVPLQTYDITHPILANNKAAECPAAGYQSINLITPLSLSGYDFYDTMRTSWRDMKVLLGPTLCRPGFTSQIHLYAINYSGLATSDTLRFTTPPGTSYVSATPSPASTTGNTLMWVLNNMAPDSVAHFAINVGISASAVLGTPLSFTARIKDPSDNNPSDNEDTLTVVVVSSHDPNRKTVNRPLRTTALRDWIYTVEFQNTGNYPAQDVVITDNLDPRLDPGTFRLLGTSHSTPKIIWGEGGQLQFRFDNIYLPDSVHSEPLSHGFITYSVSPKANVKIGDTIQNTAVIYFDYNAPVFTNTTMNILTAGQPQVLQVPGTAGGHRFGVYPNPAHSALIVVSDVTGEAVLFDMQGRSLLRFPIAGGESKIRLPEDLVPGIYILQGRSISGELLGTLRIAVK